MCKNFIDSLQFKWKNFLTTIGWVPPWWEHEHFICIINPLIRSYNNAKNIYKLIKFLIEMLCMPIGTYMCLIFGCAICKNAILKLEWWKFIRNRLVKAFRIFKTSYSLIIFVKNINFLYDDDKLHNMSEYVHFCLFSDDFFDIQNILKCIKILERVGNQNINKIIN